MAEPMNASEFAELSEACAALRDRINAAIPRLTVDTCFHDDREVVRLGRDLAESAEMFRRGADYRRRLFS